MKQFCLKGHDTFKVGRTTSHNCKTCYLLYGRRKAYEYNLKYMFNMTLEEYNIRFNEQKGLCLGCYRHQSELKYSLCVDHNHKTKKIRGLLCHPCNSALGLVKDNIDILHRLIQYLEKP